MLEYIQNYVQKSEDSSRNRGTIESILSRLRCVLVHRRERPSVARCLSILFSTQSPTRPRDGKGSPTPSRCPAHPTLYPIPTPPQTRCSANRNPDSKPNPTQSKCHNPIAHLPHPQHLSAQPCTTGTPEHRPCPCHDSIRNLRRRGYGFFPRRRRGWNNRAHIIPNSTPNPAPSHGSDAAPRGRGFAAA